MASNFIFNNAHDRLHQIMVNPEPVQIILLKAFWRDDPEGVYTEVKVSPRMKTVADILHRNRETNFGGYDRLVCRTVVRSHEHDEDWCPRHRWRFLDFARPPKWWPKAPEDFIRWGIIATLDGRPLTAHEITDWRGEDFLVEAFGDFRLAVGTGFYGWEVS